MKVTTESNRRKKNRLLKIRVSRLVYMKSDMGSFWAIGGPHMHAYSTIHSPAALLGDMLAGALNCLTFTWMCATLGTTFVCSFDNLKELGPICANENIWLHVDAAYAGTAFVCRSWMAGIEHADSLTFLPCKIMLTNFYSCIMWAKDTSIIEKTLRVEQDYANNNKSGLEINLMATTLHKTKHRQLSFTRYFHSLKTWFMLKRTGVEGIQLYVRKCVSAVGALGVRGLQVRDVRAWAWLCSGSRVTTASPSSCCRGSTTREKYTAVWPHCEKPPPSGFLLHHSTQLKMMSGETGM